MSDPNGLKWPWLMKTAAELGFDAKGAAEIARGMGLEVDEVVRNMARDFVDHKLERESDDLRDLLVPDRQVVSYASID